MKTLFALVLVASTLAGFSAANAAGGCGPGFHRGPYGACRPNAPEALRPKMGQNAELAQAFAAKMANARAEVIPDTGHLVFLEARQRFDELMLAFLGSH